MLAITQYSTVFSQNQVYFGRKKNTLGRIISRCKSAGYPPAKFSGHDTLYRVAANCSDPRAASGHHGGEQCGPQPLLWYSVPASCTPYIAGGSDPLQLPTIRASTMDAHSDFLFLLPPKRGTVLNFFSCSLFYLGQLVAIKNIKIYIENNI